jgi:hypothetical protein
MARRAYVICALAIGSVAAIVGCGGTQTIDVAAHPKLRPDNMVEFEFHGARVQLDSVLFTRDSVSGIPWHEPSLCCKRVAYALADISKPKVRTFPALGAILGVVFAVVLWFGYEVALHYD